VFPLKYKREEKPEKTSAKQHFDEADLYTNVLNYECGALPIEAKLATTYTVIS
jgi:hypothetical protein